MAKGKTVTQPTKPANDVPEGFETVSGFGAPWFTIAGESVRGVLERREEFESRFGKQARYILKLTQDTAITLSDGDGGGEVVECSAGDSISFIEKADTRCLANAIGREVYVKAGEKVAIRGGSQMMQTFKVAVSKASPDNLPF